MQTVLLACRALVLLHLALIIEIHCKIFFFKLSLQSALFAFSKEVTLRVYIRVVPAVLSFRMGVKLSGKALAQYE